MSLDNQICHKSWPEEEKLESSTWRELKAIHFGLLSFLPFVKNKVIYWFTDNKTAAFVIHNVNPLRKKWAERCVGPKNCLRIFKLSKSVNGKESIPAIHPGPKAPVTWPHPIEPRRGRVGKA